MLNKRIIKICLGSSCFSRGNNELISEIQKFIRKNSLEDKVSFSGDHCFSCCSEGPSLRINGKLFQKMDRESIDKILRKELSDLL